MARRNTTTKTPATDPAAILATLEITRKSPHAVAGTWVTGNIAGHAFEARVFPEHASDPAFELEGSRISKLWIQEHFTHKQVACFDRGWDIAPATDAAKAIVDVLAAGLAETVFGK